ncbi:hypothetical protein H112_08150 [Trichophyton rubrum D6]|uniref:Uncharacterized protein n=2 Tax=Trichophyton TaxID=5550 RepID=A0A022VP41_TRIRU|nr:hypothetical protein H100_08177 [Trichophyton rubrum MR850]EZF37430.1 hypothetical protein H102_08134 [Trichophyton rubrum CBS 100081]EZF48057.1 hypothetical protein H103_08160 [Trichophyton rubrum CBS 288.86]EZF58721.1 hypothetical protein H104_08109 [Trichophyton rubrum CBS 289.86]EZF69315.1 hypothetical protein H105_08161 [Trichophyton soudanense CBS 452.61]EZF80037.1 hypothetical protein H110_08163 [Trichophyton rubrum MR1448]EZF90651.1 hypothetical protein H113_08225 [Trichophyton rub
MHRYASMCNPYSPVTKRPKEVANPQLFSFGLGRAGRVAASNTLRANSSSISLKWFAAVLELGRSAACQLIPRAAAPSLAYGVPSPSPCSVYRYLSLYHQVLTNPWQRKLEPNKLSSW